MQNKTFYEQLHHIFYKTKNRKIDSKELGLIENPPPLYHTPFKLKQNFKTKKAQQSYKFIFVTFAMLYYHTIYTTTTLLLYYSSLSPSSISSFLLVKNLCR